VRCKERRLKSHEPEHSPTILEKAAAAAAAAATKQEATRRTKKEAIEEDIGTTYESSPPSLSLWNLD
jgi:hypothetical protein